MELIDKANVLADYWMDHRNDPEWQDFITYNDLGLPLAQGISDGFIHELTDAGEALIEESFSLLCKKLGVDEPSNDDTLEDVIGRF